MDIIDERYPKFVECADGMKTVGSFIITRDGEAMNLIEYCERIA